VNVLSLFDGISCGMLALERAAIPVDEYYASEIDKWCIQVSEKNYPNIQRLGDVQHINYQMLPDIDLLIGGSPCQGFSLAGKQLNFSDPRSSLFFEFIHAMREVKPTYFMLENVCMKKEYQNAISKLMGCEPIKINSALVSAQNRNRLYWTNISGIKQPEDKGLLLKDVLENNPGPEFNHSIQSLDYMHRRGAGGRNRFDFGYIHETKSDKSKCLVSNLYKGLPFNTLIEDCKNPPTKDQLIKCGAMRGRITEESNGKYVQQLEIRPDDKTNTLTSAQKDNYVVSGCMREIHYRKLTPLECERLQTIPEGYTDCVSNSQRYKMIGNGWTVDVIAHIFSHIRLLK